MSIKKHTPTPWVVNSSGIFVKAKKCLGCISLDNPNMDADAEFVIQAVNNHDALASALQRLIEKVRRAYEIELSTARDFEPEDWAELNMIASEGEAVLAKAKGKP